MAGRRSGMLKDLRIFLEHGFPRGPTENLKSGGSDLKFQIDGKSSIGGLPVALEDFPSIWKIYSKMTGSPPLSEKKFGPFKIASVVSKNAFCLELPSSWSRIHPVFHVSLLSPSVPPFPGKSQPPLEPVQVQDHLEWEVSAILDSRRRRGRLQYLVQWSGYMDDSDRATWEPASNLTNCPELLKKFHSAYPTKPRP
ncbi:hypothetical protein PTTG_04132 [Puccinia triticina 1-1 BBBD Race 1]|uniref:Chromo domain-containing protein n=1 Tax=Puccinia triticina (isolate 1-1 / race 1 (BBBD)) TaxID=630390 RepID=A0A180GC81_PUCT1|nr:hypothetical protein PTTG_04132 [Puccinia triticina 1-1 BBBD Race 1]